MEDLLTVIIPTIGRETIYRSLESIKHCNSRYRLYVACDNVNGEFLKELCEYLFSNSFNYRILLGNYGSPGKNKGAAIKEVTSKYFTLLDDDDAYLDYSFQYLVNVLEEFDPNWLITKSYGESSSLSYEKIKFHDSIRHSDLFDYDEWNPSFIKGVTPTENLFYRTSLYEEAPEFAKFNLDSFDDTIPASWQIINHSGIEIETNVFQENDDNFDSDRVSTRRIKSSNLKDLYESLIELSITSNERESRCWVKILSNVLKRINHVNKKLCMV